MVDFLSPDDLFADTGMVAQPSPSPLLIDHFRLHFYWRPEAAESSVQMAWENPDVGGVVRVFRQIQPVAALATTSGFQAFVPPGPGELSPFGWNVVAVMDNSYRFGRFIDEDIPAIDESLPKSARRSLGAVYSYRIEISGGERSARSPVRSTRIRGINSPRLESATGTSDSQIRVNWRDNSQLASGFRVRYFELPAGDNEQVITVNGTSREDLVIGNLSPDTEHLITVRAWDYYGESSESNSGEARTAPPDDAQPEDKTYNLNLQRQPIIQGNIPYQGRFPTAGNLPAGTLQKVSLHSAWPSLYFVKPGHSTAECNDPNAVVVLAPGGSLTAAEMTELYGNETPDLPIVFLACAEATSSLYDWIPINITYRPT